MYDIISNEYTFNLSLNGDLLEVVNSFKYLGHKLLSNFKDVDGIAFRLNCFVGSSNNIIRTFHNCLQRSLIYFFLMSTVNLTMA